LLFYSKGRTKIFNPVMGEYSPEQLSRYRGIDGTRRYKAENLTAPHFSEARTIPWRGTHPGADRQWRFSIDELERLYAEGRILLRRDGCPRKDGLKEYLDEASGAPAQDIWTDIMVGPTSGERLGYPTQKPLQLLERIIAASSNEGDMVLDPFCGCATAIAAAHKLNRRWIGIDIAFHAIKRVAQARLQDEYGLVEGEHYTVSGVPRTLEGAQSLWRQDKYAFQRWAIEQVNGFVTTKRTADGGIDGRLYFALPGENQMRSMVIEVKGGRNIGVNVIRSLVGVLMYAAVE
jgi:site-specific DNA-methyltransferase (adenine-specific)